MEYSDFMNVIVVDQTPDQYPVQLIIPAWWSGETRAVSTTGEFT